MGSFLNVVALRWNSGWGLGGRSACFSCGKALRWWELIPILSFFFLRARCSSCKSKLSWQYPLVEILTGLVFASLYYVFGPTTYYLLLTTVFCLYIVITVYDIRHKIIPDALVYLSIVLAFVLSVLRFISDLESGAWDLVAGPLIFLFFAALWLLSRGRAMGFGDAKLGLSIGLLLGASAGFSAVVLAFWIGTVVTLLYMALIRSPLLRGGKKLTMKSEIPFAPFLVLGAWVSLVYQLDLLHVAQL